MSRAFLLRKVLRRLKPPGAWTQHMMARDSEGNALFGSRGREARSPKAKSWCLSGAVACESQIFELWDFATRFPAQGAQVNALKNAVLRRGFTDSVAYNNALERTQADIIDLLHEVIHLYETEVAR